MDIRVFHIPDSRFLAKGVLHKVSPGVLILSGVLAKRLQLLYCHMFAHYGSPLHTNLVAAQSTVAHVKTMQNLVALNALCIGVGRS
jgi:hypothetical protein